MDRELTQPRTEDSFDRVLRNELSWQAPPELTDCLLAAVQSHCAAMAETPDTTPAEETQSEAARPQPWYLMLVTVLTTVAVGLSLIVAWQFYGTLGVELGLSAAWQQAQTSLTHALTWLSSNVPFMDVMLDLLGGVRNQLHWVLIAIVLWLALDGWSPRTATHQQQHASS